MITYLGLIAKGMNSSTKGNNFKLSAVLVKTQNSILSAAFILAASSGINAILGVAKSSLLVRFFGVTNNLAVFYTADHIPNLIYSVLIVGAVSTVFIPVFTGAMKKNKEEAYKTGSSIIMATLAFFFIAALLIFIFSSQIMTLLSLGKFNSEEIQLGTNLMRIMLFAQLILVGGSLVTSILQSMKYFLVPALAPIAYNIGMISGIVFLSGKYGIYGPAFGVVLGSLLFLFIQLPLLGKTGFVFSTSISLKDKNFKKMFSLIPPRILSVLIANLIQTINNSLAIWVSASSVVYLKFALQLQTFPVSLFGLSMAAASLPTLSQESDKDNLKDFKKTFTTSFHQMMYLVMPLSAILLILRIPAVRLVYGVPNFPWIGTIETAITLAFFSISIFSQSANYLITRTFYALKDTVTPVVVATITATINVVLSALFVGILHYSVWSIAFSFSITSILDMLILLFLLDRKIGGFENQRLVTPFFKISLATVTMGIMLYLPMKLLDTYVLDTTRTVNLLILTIAAGIIGCITYLGLTKIFKVEEISLFYKLLRKLNLTREAIVSDTLTQKEESGINY